MKAKNANLQKAKKEANDEFYTQYEYIAKEIEHYKEHLKGKVIYCNCDIPYFSNFHKYFLDNFKELELKQLIVTGYVKNGNGKCSIYDGEKSTDYDLLGDGDFRGDECIDMLQKADVVITNPPFSLFREFIKVVIDNRKDFIVVGNKNAIGYKDVFPLIKENKMWLGVKSLGVDTYFDMPKAYVDELVAYKKEGSAYKIINGKIMGRVQTCWFTSFNVRKNDYLELTKEYNESEYPKYDNYDTINVDKTKDIPKDYDGVMGVPITFLDKYNPSQFEIVGIDRYVADNPHYGRRFTLNGKKIYARILIKRKG